MSINCIWWCKSWGSTGKSLRLYWFDESNARTPEGERACLSFVEENFGVKYWPKRCFLPGFVSATTNWLLNHWKFSNIITATNVPRYNARLPAKFLGYVEPIDVIRVSSFFDNYWFFSRNFCEGYFQNQGYRLRRIGTVLNISILLVDHSLPLGNLCKKVIFRPWRCMLWSHMWMLGERGQKWKVVLSLVNETLTPYLENSRKYMKFVCEEPSANKLWKSDLVKSLSSFENSVFFCYRISKLHHFMVACSTALVLGFG